MLDPTGDALADLARACTDFAVRSLAALPDASPVGDDGSAVLADRSLRRDPPEAGRPLVDVLADLDRAAGPGVLTGSPGFLAFVPGSGCASGAFAELLAASLNRYTGLAFSAPGLVALEADLLRWLAGCFGLPGTAAGLLVSGGSTATLTALVTARTALLPEDFLAGTVYLTSESHEAVAKAARLAGFPRAALRRVPVDERSRMVPGQLRAAVAADRAAGRVPFCVVATAGTTNSGAVDPLPELARVAADEGLWLHVDGAYGGAFQLTERGRDRLHGIEQADSLVLDPHKGFFLPFGTGCLLVRDGDLLRRAHTPETGDYLQDVPALDLPDFADLGPELTRAARGLRLWLPLHLHGVGAFRDALDAQLDLAQLAAEALATDPHVRVFARPELSIVTFGCTVPGRALPPEQEDALTARVLAAVNAERRVFLSSTRIAGRYAGRVCVLNHRVERSHVLDAVDAVHRHATALAVAV